MIVMVNGTEGSSDDSEG